MERTDADFVTASPLPAVPHHGQHASDLLELLGLDELVLLLELPAVLLFEVERAVVLVGVAVLAAEDEFAAALDASDADLVSEEAEADRRVEKQLRRLKKD